MANDNRIDVRRGERVYFIRSAVLGLKSAREFASALTNAGFKVSRGGVANWEQGKNIGIEAMRAISKLAHVDLNWISHEEGSAPVGKHGETFKNLPSSEAPRTSAEVDKLKIEVSTKQREGSRRADLSIQLADLFAQIMRLDPDSQNQFVLLIKGRLSADQKSRAMTTKQPS